MTMVCVLLASGKLEPSIHIAFWILAVEVTSWEMKVLKKWKFVLKWNIIETVVNLYGGFIYVQ